MRHERQVARRPILSANPRWPTHNSKPTTHNFASKTVSKTVYYVGRFAQLLGMWLLVVDVFTAGPLGPSARLFALGVAVFLAGWGLTRTFDTR
jgi:hypothetical protein